MTTRYGKRSVLEDVAFDRSGSAKYIVVFVVFALLSREVCTNLCSSTNKNVCPSSCPSSDFPSKQSLFGEYARAYL
jgi:hypothetical protein